MFHSHSTKLRRWNSGRPLGARFLWRFIKPAVSLDRTIHTNSKSLHKLPQHTSCGGLGFDRDSLMRPNDSQFCHDTGMDYAILLKVMEGGVHCINP